MSLVEFLNQNGYTRIELTRSGVGHFHTDGFLNDRPISVLIDTGASSTVFNLDLAGELNLSRDKLEISGGGAGAAKLDVYQIHEARFIIGNVSPAIQAFLAMDLTHVNQALALRGETPVDAVLGADALEAHRAVIDYGSSSLFLKV